MKKARPSLLVTLGLPVVCITAALHLFFYRVQPLEFPWNDVVVELLTVGAAVLTAGIATAVWGLFNPDELPRGVWKFFALGAWCFAIARSIVFISFYFPSYDDSFSAVNLPDIFYLAGIAFFFYSQKIQFRLILEPAPGGERRTLLKTAAAVLVGTLVSAFLLPHLFTRSMNWLTAFRQGFYICIGLVILAAAVRLSSYFGAGMWGRAWWGVMAFIVAHFMFTVLTSSGNYSHSIEFGNIFSLLADTLYLLAYLLSGWTCFNQYLLVRFGPTLRSQEVEAV